MVWLNSYLVINSPPSSCGSFRPAQLYPSSLNSPTSFPSPPFCGAVSVPQSFARAAWHIRTLDAQQRSPGLCWASAPLQQNCSLAALSTNMLQKRKGSVIGQAARVHWSFSLYGCIPDFNKNRQFSSGAEKQPYFQVATREGKLPLAWAGTRRAPRRKAEELYCLLRLLSSFDWMSLLWR